MGLAQVGMGFLDDRASFRKALRGLAGDGRDFGIDRRDAEIGRIGDALRLAAGTDGGQKRIRQHRQRQRIGGMLAAHGIEQQRDVFDIARHRALDAEIAIDRCGYRMRDAADARPQSDDAAEARGVAQATAHVGAVRQPRGAGGERHRRATRGAGGGAGRIPGIARRAEHFVEGVGAGAEFRRVRLGVDHPAIVFEMLDQDIRLRRDIILVDRRALRGQDAGDIGQVLDRDRQPREQPALGGRLLHQRGGVLAGAVEAQRRQRVDLAVDLGDAFFQHVEQVERGNFARFQFADDGTRRLTHQPLISHFAISVRFRFLIADGAVEHFPAKWNVRKL